jgi:soluble lytic murein transglycosylase-like protein
LKSGQIGLEHRRQRLRTEALLVEILHRISRDRLPDSTVGTLVSHVHRHSRRFGYDPLLVFAVIQTESMFDAEALGRFRSGRRSGALGLMQLKYPTALEVAEDLGMTLTSPSDLFKPEINIPLGIAYLTRQVSRFNSFKLGLLAYNQGPGTIQTTLRAKQPLSIGYYRKVLNHYYRFQSVRKSMMAEILEEPGR